MEKKKLLVTTPSSHVINMHIRAHTSILFPLQFVCVCEWVTMRKKNQLYQISSFLPPDYYHHYYYILLYFLVVISSEWFFSWCVVMCACVGLLVISTDWNKTTTTAVKVNVQIFCLFFFLFLHTHTYISCFIFGSQLGCYERLLLFCSWRTCHNDEDNSIIISAIACIRSPPSSDSINIVDARQQTTNQLLLFPLFLYFSLYILCVYVWSLVCSL